MARGHAGDAWEPLHPCSSRNRLGENCRVPATMCAAFSPRAQNLGLRLSH